MSTYEISKSSLLSLKAEILKKQEELIKAKLDNKAKLEKDVKKTPLEFKNKGVEERQAENDLTEEDENLLRQSRVALEAKSKLYDKLSNQKSTKETEKITRHYLVRFDKKSKKSKLPDYINTDDEEDDYDRHPDREDTTTRYKEKEEVYKSKNPNDDWVEYTDCFGRTRMCLKKDLPHMKENDEEMRSAAESRQQSQCPTEDNKNNEKDDVQSDTSNGSDKEEFNEESELLSGDMRRELMRQQWEREEEELQSKTDVHYQDILFNEARSHGVGYYGFSKDEAERAKQQDALNKLRKETQQQQRMAQEIKKNRERQLNARIIAAKNRKRARMGLPPLTEEEIEEEKKQEQVDVIEPIQPKEKSAEEIKEEKEREKARLKHIRPWDIGKDGLKKKHYEYSQDEWVKVQREKRDDDFAPPRSYYSTHRRELPDETEKGLYFTSNRKKVNEEFKVGKLNPYKSDDADQVYEVDEFQSDTLDELNWRDKKASFTPTPIQDESIDDDSAPEDCLMQDYVKTTVNKKGVEIAPPPTYDYYGPSDRKRSKTAPYPASSMEDSIMQGLKFLRDKVEGKNKKS